MPHSYKIQEVGNTLSEPKSITGGAVQGSILGVMDHNAVLEDVDEDFGIQAEKYVDDLTVLENIPKDAPHLTDNQNNIVVTRAKKTEKTLERLSATCSRKNLKTNEKKTQLLTINTERKKNESWIKTLDGSEIKCMESLKMLGFVFNRSGNCNDQITNLVRKAMSRSYVLRYYSKFMPGKDLKKLYCALVRSILEFSSVSFGSQISKFQSNRIENVQKRCLKIMYGYNHTYEELLQMAGLQSLKGRRESAMLKFAQRMADNSNYCDLFPINTLSLIHI